MSAYCGNDLRIAHVPEGRAVGYRHAGAVSASNHKLLLLHGIGSNALSFRPQLEQLSDEFEVVAWDAPGYGASADPPTPLLSKISRMPRSHCSTHWSGTVPTFWAIPSAGLWLRCCTSATRNASAV